MTAQNTIHLLKCLMPRKKNMGFQTLKITRKWFKRKTKKRLRKAKAAIHGASLRQMELDMTH